MHGIREWVHRLLGTVRPSRRDDDLTEELRAHAALAAERGQRATGTSQAMDALRDQRGLPWMEEIARDVTHALRALRRSPAFTIAATATLALGIAAMVAIFSVLDQVVLRPLPYPDMDRLVRIESPVPGIRPDAVWNLSTAEYFYFRRDARTLERVGIYVTSSATVGAGSGRGDAVAERVLTTLVSPEVLGLIGARPVLGRLLTEQDSRYDPRDGAPGVIISHSLWQNRFGGAPDVIGRPIVLNERSIPIVGVVPPGIAGPPDASFLSGRSVDAWMPLPLDPSAPAVNQHTYRAIGRLRPGVEPAAAQQELVQLTRRLPELFPTAYSPAFMESGFTARVVPLRDSILGATSRVLWVLAAAISLVFVIAAANVTNLFLLHAEARRQELATRLALGATRTRLARYLLAESVLLSTFAALLAIGLAFLALRAVILVAPENLPRLGTVAVDGRTIALAFAAAVMAAICFASFTVARFSRTSSGTLRPSVTTTTPRQARTKSALVVAQVALSLVLACGAALMAQSVERLLDVDPGFDPAGVVTVSVVLPRTRYETEPQIAGYRRDLEATLEADPEIEVAAAATTTPLDGNDGCTVVFVQGRTRNDANGNLCMDVSRVSPTYFEAAGISIRGRHDQWRKAQTGMVIVSESAARHIWPGQNPIGKGLRVSGFAPPYYEVVGVAEDVRRLGFDRPVAESVYFPMVALEGSPIFAPPRAMRLVLRTRTRDAAALIGRVRNAVAAADANVPIADVEWMEDLVAQSMARNALAASLLTAAAVLALVLSAVGLYGVVSYGVASRARELGVRLAIGAAPPGIRRLVLRETVILLLPGLMLGVFVSLSSMPLLEGLLFGIAPRDVATLVGVSGVLLLSGIAAGALPAWRASRLDPVVVLRAE